MQYRCNNSTARGLRLEAIGCNIARLMIKSPQLMLGANKIRLGKLETAIGLQAGRPLMRH
eukprot:1142194-Pelagomonas_calceolata.AAC.3